MRPRVSSRVLCAVFGVLMIAISFGAWWIAVRTEDGQSYEDMVFSGFHDSCRRGRPLWSPRSSAAISRQSPGIR